MAPHIRSPLADAVRKGLADGLGVEDVIAGTNYSLGIARRIVEGFRATGELTEIMELRRDRQRQEWRLR